MKRAFMTALFLLAVNFSAFADEESVKKYRNFTPEQIRDLPEKVRSSGVPMMYTMAAQEGLGIGSELLFAMQLNSLMYPGIHDYNAAVKAFQVDLGDRPTGALTVWQIHNLQQRSEMQKLADVSFPANYSSYITKDFASVQGTLIILDDKVAWPVNRTKVQCYRAEKYCEYSSLVLVLPDEKSWTQSYQVMETSGTIYKITRWDNNEIDAVPSNDGAGVCRTTSLNYNFKTKEFYEIARNKAGECLVPNLDKLPKPRVSQIVDGKSIIQKEFGAIKKKAYEAWASDFRKKIDKLNAQSTPNK